MGLDARSDTILLTELSHGARTASDLERALFVGLEEVTVADVEAWCSDAARRGLVEPTTASRWAITAAGAAKLGP